MSPTESRQHKESTAGEPLPGEVMANATLAAEASSEADTTPTSEANAQRVPSSGGEGAIWLRCRVRQGRLGTGESSTRG